MMSEYLNNNIVALKEWGPSTSSPRACKNGAPQRFAVQVVLAGPLKHLIPLVLNFSQELFFLYLIGDTTSAE